MEPPSIGLKSPQSSSGAMPSVAPGVGAPQLVIGMSTPDLGNACQTGFMIATVHAAHFTVARSSQHRRQMSAATSVWPRTRTATRSSRPPSCGSTSGRAGRRQRRRLRHHRRRPRRRRPNHRRPNHRRPDRRRPNRRRPNRRRPTRRRPTRPRRRHRRRRCPRPVAAAPGSMPVSVRARWCSAGSWWRWPRDACGPTATRLCLGDLGRGAAGDHRRPALR